MNKLAKQTIVVAALVGAAMFFAGRGCAGTDICPAGGGSVESGVAVRVDTFVVRDTIREKVPVASHSVVTRVDTVWVKAAGNTIYLAAGDTTHIAAGEGASLAAEDTVYVAAEIPIERNIYQTADYRAVVEGFRASLVSMELYRRTPFVTKTVSVSDTRRWGVELQAGWGFSSKGAAPYVGIGVGYRIWGR